MPIGGGWRPLRHKRADNALGRGLLATCRYPLRRVGRFYQMQNQCGFDALKLGNYAGDLGREVTY